MHPEVRAASGAPCPLCGMALVPRHPRARSDGPLVPEEAIGQATTMGVSQEIAAPAWVEDGQGERAISALMYNDELATLSPADTAMFRASPGPARRMGPPVRVGRLADRPRAWDQATSRVRWRVLDGTRLPGGETGWLEIAARDREVTVVPYQAIVPSPEGPAALVVSTDRRTIARRPLTTGRVVFDFATVIGGLGPGDRLVTEGALLHEAERRLGLPPVAAEAPP
jgi:hypothetical protein